jgi:hypothetical protein
VQLPHPLDRGALVVKEAGVEVWRDAEATLKHNILVLSPSLLAFAARLPAVLAPARRCPIIIKSRKN